MILVGLLYALFASIFTIAKVSLGSVQPFFLVGVRMVLASGILIAYKVLWKKEPLGIEKRHLWKLFLMGTFAIYCTNAFEFWGLQFLSPSKTCFIYSLSPFMSALLSYLFLSEVMTWRKWLGLTIGFLGFIPILMSQSDSELNTGSIFYLSLAEIAVLFAAVCSSYGWIVMRDLVHNHRLSPIAINGVSMFIGGVMSLVNSAFVETWNPLPVSHYGPFIEGTLLMILVSNLICYNLYGHLLKRFTATFLSFAGFITPFWTALYDWIVFRHIVSSHFVLSFVVVFIGLVFFYQEELARGGVKKSGAEA